MRLPVGAIAICLFALAGCEQSYSSTTTVTETGGEVVERTVEVQIGDRRAPSTVGEAGATPAETATPAAADAPVAPVAPEA